MMYVVVPYLAVGGFTLITAFQGSPPEKRTWRHNLGRTVSCLVAWPWVWFHVWKQLR